MSQHTRNESLPVRRRTVALAGGGVEVRHLVPCAASGGASPLEECGACARCVALPVSADAPDAEVVCRSSTSQTPSVGSVARSEMDVVELALRTPVRDVVGHDVRAARSDVTVREARELVGRGDPLLVVDEASRPRGVVRASDLASSDVDPDACLARVATPIRASVRDDTALVHTLAELGEGDGAVLPIVDEDGALLGVLTAVDVVRWLAKRAGYDL